MDLYQAAGQGSIDDIESAVEEGCDVNTQDEYGLTPLWFAVQGGQVDACRILIARGASVEGQRPSILELAVQQRHTEIVELLWPHCKAEREYRALESAISLGFHEIADFLVGTQEFEYQHSQANDIEMLIKDGFPSREIPGFFEQWERFIFVRRSEKLHLHRIFLDYALLLATKADRNAGIRLVNLLLEGEIPIADANCKIKIDEEFETPLTNAAEKGNLEILATLIELPQIKLTLRGKYNWPAFLHLLASSESITSEKGRTIAQKLSKKTLPDSLLVDTKLAHLETVFENVLRLGDDALISQVIDLVHGAAGIVILPLLIKVNERHGLRWILNSDIVHASKPPPILWVLLCNFFQRSPNSEAMRLFTRVAEFLVENAIWDRVILVCLDSHNFCFMKQFFYPLNKIPPGEVTEETLEGLPQASTDQSLVREWVDKGFANAALWSAIRSGVWKSPAFERLLSCSDVDLDEPAPRKKIPGAGERMDLSPPFFGNFIGKKPKFSFNPSAEDSPRLPLEPVVPENHAQKDYEMQLSRLEQQNRIRLMMARNEQDTKLGKTVLAWAVTSHNVQLVEVLLRTSRVNVNSQGPHNTTPLMHAISVNDVQIVEKLLEIGNIDLNLRDDEGRTAIFLAAQAGDLHIIRLLTSTKNVDFSIRDCNGENVQDLAKRMGSQDVVAALAT
ncbi:hypothetical protein PENVUL_c044G04241 [Penicillium vulpinum]|uniref:Uncharacterized protein n=2 Tax=Penicillium vulpinum TaxID=29845 RepID=A0A1V6RHA8_9EURO|nr:hypothetical protein PENVUL_c044G04241 [Penicillium vulpinum]